ncbi:Mitochondria fission 1 protein [Talaromyces islandicus]|uniref:Mitochondrial fission 1 protein n=1 Tax=Talaromyces islandicus TaxID=28573 RepID=A0A0U1LLM5_TALIS|nr:Mitochondria fission 1 protein [Talaromyces islandicus]
MYVLSSPLPASWHCALYTGCCPLKPAELQVLRAQYEKEGDYVGVQTKFNYAWGLIKSNTRTEQQEGVRLLSEIFRSAPERRRECLYYLALGNFKLGNYAEARRYNDLLLDHEPGNLQAASLRQLIDDKVAKEGLVGVAIVGGLALAAGLIEPSTGEAPIDDFPSHASSPPPLPPFSSRPSRSPRPPDDSRYGILDHNPWQNVGDDNDEQDNGNGPRYSSRSYRSPDGRFTMTRTTITSGMPGGRRRSMGSPEPFAAPDPLMQTIGSFFQEIAGAYGTRGRDVRTPDQEDPWEDDFDSPRGNSNNSSSQNRGAFGGDTFLRPPGLFPRNTNGTQQANLPLTNFNDLFNILRNEADPEGTHRPSGEIHILGAGGTPVHPLSLLASLLTGGRLGGDVVYSQEELDHVISQLIDQNTNQGAPPATESAIQSLPKIKINTEMLGTEGRAECSICMDPVELGTEVTELPCKHWFHGECIELWLKQHNTCPHCRRGINEGDEAPGSRNNPMVIPSSPPQSPNGQPSNYHSDFPYHGGRHQRFGSSSTFNGNSPGPRQSHSAPPEPDQNRSNQDESTPPGGGLTGWFRSRFGSG